MDINEIISNAIDKSTNEVFENKLKKFDFSDDKLTSLTKENYSLIKYCNILLEEYHTALKKELDKQGISV